MIDEVAPSTRSPSTGAAKRPDEPARPRSRRRRGRGPAPPGRSPTRSRARLAPEAPEPPEPHVAVPGIAAGEAGTGLRRATAVMAVGTTLSRVTGVLRHRRPRLRPRHADALADSYNLANTLPNIVHDIVLGGVLSATFVPVFVQRLTTRHDDEAWEAISAVVSVTMIVIAAASLLFLLAVPFIIDATTVAQPRRPGGPGRAVAKDLLFLFVPQLTCYGFISVGTALLNARRKFGAPMFTPIANNVVLIAVLSSSASPCATPRWRGGRRPGPAPPPRAGHHRRGRGPGRASWSRACAGPACGCAGTPTSATRRCAPSCACRAGPSGWSWPTRWPSWWCWPCRSRSGPGAVSVYTYAYTFFQLPYGIVAVSIMSATAPELTARWASGDLVAFRRRMGTGLRAMLAIIIPAAAGELVLARPRWRWCSATAPPGHGDTARPPWRWPCWRSGCPGSVSFSTPCACCSRCRTCARRSGCTPLENGVNIVLAVVLAGPFGVRGIALSISIAYTRRRRWSPSATCAPASRAWAEACSGRPLGHVVLATGALVVAAALGSNVSGSETTVILLGRVVLGSLAGPAAYVLAAGAPGRAGPATSTGPRYEEAHRRPDGPAARPPSATGTAGRPPAARRPATRRRPAGRPPLRPARGSGPPGTRRAGRVARGARPGL